MIKRHLCLALLCLTPLCIRAAEPPTDWVDRDTGHRVVRLSREPESASLYFHQNPFTAEGDKMIFAAPGGLSTIDLKTHEIKLIVPGFKYSVRGSGAIAPR